MPTGIPDASALISSLRSNVGYAVEYLEIPPLGLVKEQFQIAVRDADTSIRSSAAFVRTTSRPFVILVALISRYILQFLKIIAEHTIYHGILVAKEMWRQLRVATLWLIDYQKSLSHTAIYMEIGFIFLLIGLYAIREYIKRKKYVERATRWYRTKRSATIMKYNRCIDRVAQTSLVLALLLPHIMYVLLMSCMKWFFPSVVRYFACKAPIPISDIISVYVPFVKTIVVIHKWRTFGFQSMKQKLSEREDQDDVKKSAANATSGGFMSMFRRKRVGSAYKNAIGKQSKRFDEEKKSQVVRTRLSEEQKQVVEEASQLLQYWVVYALIYSAAQTMLLLPIVSRFFSNVNTKAKPISSLPWKRKKISWLDRIDFKPSKEFFDECRLLFFVWLRMLPTSLTGGSKRGAGKNDDVKSAPNASAGHSVKKRIAAFENSKSKLRKDIKNPFSNIPIDIIYDRLSPMVISALSSSSRLLIHHHDSSVAAASGHHRSLLMRGVGFCRSFLDAMVWTKMISTDTKNWIVGVLVECSDLLPASVTLFMPAYFTNYGIIFVSLIVPCAKSAIACNSLKGSKTNTETVKIMEESALRFMQYWIIQSIISWTISAFSPVLAWVPLSTHMALLVWAYAQLEGTTVSLYNTLEWDLVAFGLLNPNLHQQKESSDINIEDSMAMKVFNSIAKHVPSSRPSQDSLAISSDGDKSDEKDKKEYVKAVVASEPGDDGDDGDDLDSNSGDSDDGKEPALQDLDKKEGSENSSIPNPQNIEKVAGKQDESLGQQPIESAIKNK